MGGMGESARGDRDMDSSDSNSYTFICYSNSSYACVQSRCETRDSRGAGSEAPAPFTITITITITNYITVTITIIDILPIPFTGTINITGTITIPIPVTITITDSMPIPITHNIYCVTRTNDVRDSRGAGREASFASSAPSCPSPYAHPRTRRKASSQSYIE